MNWVTLWLSEAKRGNENKWRVLFPMERGRNLVIKLILFLSGRETSFPLGVCSDAGLHDAEWWIRCLMSGWQMLDVKLKTRYWFSSGTHFNKPTFGFQVLIVYRFLFPYFLCRRIIKYQSCMLSETVEGEIGHWANETLQHQIWRKRCSTFQIIYFIAKGSLFSLFFFLICHVKYIHIRKIYDTF